MVVYPFYGVQVKTKDKAALTSQHLEFLLLIVLVVIYFVWFAWPLVWAASDNARLVFAFNFDEALHLHILKEAISQRTLKLDFDNYGHLQFNTALLPLLFLSYFTPVSEQQIIIALRLVSTTFAIATVGVTFLLARRYFGRLVAWLAAFLLSIVPLSFLDMSVMSHPDTPQLFFLVLGSYLCCRLVEEEGDIKWLIMASASAGLAFASKYSGMFLLPIIWAVIITQIIITGDNSQFKIDPARFARVIRYATAAMGIIGVVTWAVVTPDFVARYFTTDGRIDNISQLQFLNSLKIIAILIGCGLVLIANLNFIWSAIGQAPKLANGLGKVTLSFAMFGVAFFLASPFSFAKLNFLQGMIYESRHTAFGHWFAADRNGLLWLPVLWSSQLLDGFLLLGLAALSLALTIYRISKSGWKQLLSPESVLWAWVIFHLSFLILRVNMRPAHYLLPIIPFLIIFSAQSVSLVIDYAANKLSGKGSVVITVAILLIIGGLELPKSFSRISEFRQSMINRVQTSASVKAGQWLAEHYPVSTRVLYDYFNYIPPSFTDVYATGGGGTIQMLKTLKPHVVIVNKRISDTFSDVGQATKYGKGENEFMKKYEYYQALRDGKINYMLVYDLEEVQIYVRQ